MSVTKSPFAMEKIHKFHRQGYNKNMEKNRKFQNLERNIWGDMVSKNEVTTEKTYIEGVRINFLYIDSVC